jgi:DNA repair exonuclease SbcCD ATPase subunit
MTTDNETKLRELRAKLTTLDRVDGERRAKIAGLSSSIEAAAEAAALTGETAEVQRLREQQSKLQAEQLASADIRSALSRLMAEAERERASEIEASRIAQVKEAAAELAGEVVALHASIGALAESCRSYLQAADAYAALANEKDRDSRGHPARVRESLRGVLTVELAAYAAATGSIPSGGKLPTLYGAAFTRDWLAA